jgi:hypothetical protein
MWVQQKNLMKNIPRISGLYFVQPFPFYSEIGVTDSVLNRFRKIPPEAFFILNWVCRFGQYR